MKKLAGMGSLFSVFALVACGHGGVAGRATVRVAAPQLARMAETADFGQYAAKRVVRHSVAIRNMGATKGRAALSKIAIMTPSQTWHSSDGKGGRKLQGRGLASEQGPYNTGKRGSMALLNKGMLIKSGALVNTKAINMGRSRKGKLSQLNTTMMIKGGAMARQDSVRVDRNSRIRVPHSSFKHHSFNVRRLYRVPRSSVRSRLGGRCFGSNCSD